ncbi:uncharacterized protein LOC135430005 isoform X1 [Drosophila montana]|uniref:uncharacterized protein LOC135430005 isoform X1 n=1 Tax=Drosophila montana TaxID=40370 RepID=UPI00313E0CE5
MSYANCSQFCSLDQLRAWVECSPLAHKCLIIHMTNDLDQIINGFETVRKLARNWDEDMQRPLLVAVCMLFLIHGPLEPQKNMRSLLFRVLGLMDTKDPMSVHGHVEYLLAELHKVDVDQDTILLHLALGLVRANARGLPIGVCMLWSIIGQILNLDITMHRYREFKELAQALGPVARFSLAEMGTGQLSELDLLLETMNRIMELVMLTNNDDLKLAGYPDHFFQMRRSDLESMLNWATTILYQIHMSCRWLGQIGSQVTAMVSILNRIKLEIPELVEEEELPKMWQAPIDTYSDLDD